MGSMLIRPSLVVGFCGQLAEYWRRFRGRTVPNKRTLIAVNRHVRGCGMFPSAFLSERVSRRDEENWLLWWISVHTGVGEGSSSQLLGHPMIVWLALNVEDLYSIHIQSTQHLEPWKVGVWQVDRCSPAIWPVILLADEALFTRDWTVRSFQKKFSINIWCGIILNTLVGRHVCEGDLTGRMYLSFFQSELLLLRKDVPFVARLLMHYQWLQRTNLTLTAWVRSNQR
jgi:hypothetical protein